MINSLEKMLKENGDKISAEDRATLETAVEKCKKEIESEDVEVIRKALEDLSQSSSGVISKLYQQAQAQTAAENGNNNGDDEIIVDDKKD